MRSIESRRHASRDPGGVHLNAAGIALARRVGAESGPFDRVVASPIPRAVETAEIISGGRVGTIASLAAMGCTVEARLGPIVRWSDFARSVRESPVVARFASEQAELLRTIAAALPEAGPALVVSHGGVLELGAVAALPDAAHETWGGPAGYAEGIRLRFEQGRFISGTLLRVDG